MKTTKKLLTLALAAMLLLSLAVSAMADEYDEKETYVDGFFITEYYYHDTKETERYLNGYDGPGGDVVIPDGINVVSYSAFEGYDSMTSVTIPSSVIAIFTYAFKDCTSLKSVTIPSGVTEIWAEAFEACTNLKSATIPSSVTFLGPSLFAGCTSLTDVYFGGTREQWATLEKKLEEASVAYGEDQTILGDGTNATVHYNSTGPDTPTTPETPTTPSFGDVPADAWYAKPVAWAVEKGITNGTSKTTFSPDTTCNNSEILTFLWRACGKPTAPEASFSDVASGAWYADAANWAKSKGMVSGDTLSPTQPCTRASAVMFIWQAMGKPTASKAASFTDVPANADYAAAVAWAVEKGVTNGTGADTFSPGTICTRAQIVAFLQRAYA